MSAFKPDDDRNSGAWIAVEKYRQEIELDQLEYKRITNIENPQLTRDLLVIKECLRRIIKAGNA